MPLKLSLSSSAPVRARADVLALPVAAGTKFVGGSADVDDTLEGALARAARAGDRRLRPAYRPHDYRRMTAGSPDGGPDDNAASRFSISGVEPPRTTACR